MLKVVIVGYGEMFTNIIAGTLDSNAKIVGVFRHNRIKYPRFIRWIKDNINPDQDFNYVKSYKLKEIKSNSINSDSFKKQLLKLNPDIMLVASWSEKIKKVIFDIPKIATINVHPSLLPKYRGPNPYMQTILNLEKQSGVTFHLMNEKFDSGAILDQRIVEIDKNDTAKELKAKTVLTARGAICELLEKLSEDVIFPVSQNEDKATYYSTDFNPNIDFNENSDKISAQIRCIHPWSKTYFYINNNIFIPNPYKISVIENLTQYNKAGTIVDIDINDRSLTIICNDNKLIRLSGLRHYNKLKNIFINKCLKNIKIGDIAD